MQSSSHDLPTVTATGETEVPVLADQATLSVAVTVRNQNQQAVLARRREAVAVVRTVLARATELRQDNEQVNESLLRDQFHQAEWSVALVAEDAAGVDQLVEVVSRLSGVADCQVQGPSWQLSSAARHTAHLRGLEQATADARAQAEAMVSGLGGKITGVTAVNAGSEVPMIMTAGTNVGRVAMAAETAALPERSLEIVANPTTEFVTASVEVKFTAAFPG